MIAACVAAAQEADIKANVNRKRGDRKDQCVRSLEQKVHNINVISPFCFCIFFPLPLLRPTILQILHNVIYTCSNHYILDERLQDSILHMG